MSYNSYVSSEIEIEIEIGRRHFVLVTYGEGRIPDQINRINPLTPMSDQDGISPYYIYTISCRHVMRIKKNINYGITN